MLTRVLTGVVGIPIAVILVFWRVRDALPFTIAVAVFALLGTLEFYGVTRRKGARPVEWAGLAAVVLIIWAARSEQLRGSGVLVPGVFTLLLVLSFAVELIRQNRSPVTNVGATLLGAAYVGWLFAHLILLRDMPGRLTVAGRASDAGAWLVMLVLASTWTCDTVAYFIGKHYGTRKLAPSLSPGKTVEGSVAGFVGALLMAVIVGTIIGLPAQHSLALGVIFGIAAQVGDLWESAVKRESGVKDSGRIIPGHGGVLDRFDALLLTAPAAYYYAALLLGNWP